MTKFITLEINNKKNGRAWKAASHKIRRIYRFLEAHKSTDSSYKVRVDYGRGFANWGTYENATDAKEALQAFIQEDY